MIYVHNPLRPLPVPPAYQNFSYYAFRSHHHHKAVHSSPNGGETANLSPGHGPAGSPHRQQQRKEGGGAAKENGLSRRNTTTSAARSVRSTRSKRFSIRNASDDEEMVDDKGERIPKYKRDFMKFHGDNGVRVVVGTFGPVKGVEMLLKKGYRHVYMSRHFATRFGLVPNEVVPGWVSFTPCSVTRY